MHPTPAFWQTLDALVAESTIKIDRPKGSAHPRYPQSIYPLDYGYLQNTTAMDGSGIDVWVGSCPAQKVDAIMCVVDIVKRDSEMKILIGCTEDEKMTVYETHNCYASMKGILIRRGEDNIQIITAYYPSEDKWGNNFKTRKVAN